MNKREMLEHRARQDVLVSRNSRYKSCAKKIRDLEAEQIMREVEASDEEYFDKLLSEVA